VIQPCPTVNPPPSCAELPAGSDFAIGPQTIPTIGDSLSAANISWKYYGEGYKQAAAPLPGSLLYCAICNGFQYSRSIMTSPLKSNLVDFDDTTFFTDVAGRRVSFVKPDTLRQPSGNLDAAAVRGLREEDHQAVQNWHCGSPAI
jgi:hypothetical protein